MSTAFEVDNHIATLFSTQVPLLDGLYDLTPDQVLLDQAAHESEVRSYPRRIPIAIKQAYGCLVEDTRGQIFLKLGNWEEALNDLEFALRSNPTDPNIHAGLSSVYQQIVPPQEQLSKTHARIARSLRCDHSSLTDLDVVVSPRGLGRSAPESAS